MNSEKVVIKEKQDYMKRNVYVGVLLTALLMTSCINTKRIVYLEDMKNRYLIR